MLSYRNYITLGNNNSNIHVEKGVLTPDEWFELINKKHNEHSCCLAQRYFLTCFKGFLMSPISFHYQRGGKIIRVLNNHKLKIIFSGDISKKVLY